MKNKFLILQLTGWIISILLFYFYLSQRLAGAGTEYILAITITSFASFAILIYGYVYFLHPRFSKTLNPFLFGVVLILFYLSVVGLRLFTEVYLVAPLTHFNSSIFNFGRTQILYDLISCFIALIIGVMLKAVIDSITSQKREAEIKRKHAEAELKLLKAQVQPHFLFNSFNNLYYDTYKALPDVARRISMLSDIMRYFLEESVKEKVHVKKEIDFIKNYIELEKVRFSNPLKIEFIVECPENVMVPPMLFMPLVENLFKHGIVKNGVENTAIIKLTRQNGMIDFEVINKLFPKSENRAGTGLKNLRERLHFLYPGNFSLIANPVNGSFHSQLTFPAS